MNVYGLVTPYGTLYVVLDAPVIASDDVRTADVQGDDDDTDALPVGMYL
jgi:hypothetical protein